MSLFYLHRYNKTMLSPRPPPQRPLPKRQNNIIIISYPPTPPPTPLPTFLLERSSSSSSFSIREHENCKSKTNKSNNNHPISLNISSQSLETEGTASTPSALPSPQPPKWKIISNSLKLMQQYAAEDALRRQPAARRGCDMSNLGETPQRPNVAAAPVHCVEHSVVLTRPHDDDDLLNLETRKRALGANPIIDREGCAELYNDPERNFGRGRHSDDVNNNNNNNNNRDVNERSVFDVEVMPMPIVSPSVARMLSPNKPSSSPQSLSSPTTTTTTTTTTRIQNHRLGDYMTTRTDRHKSNKKAASRKGKNNKTVVVIQDEDLDDDELLKQQPANQSCDNLKRDTTLMGNAEFLSYLNPVDPSKVITHAELSLVRGKRVIEQQRRMTTARASILFMGLEKRDAAFDVYTATKTRNDVMTTENFDRDDVEDDNHLPQLSIGRRRSTRSLKKLMNKHRSEPVVFPKLAVHEPMDFSVFRMKARVTGKFVQLHNVMSKSGL